MGDSLRSIRQELDLIIQCNSEEEVFDVVSEQSKDTLEIINIFIPSEKFVKIVKDSENGVDEYMRQYMELCLPIKNTEIIKITSNKPTMIGNN
ncbi:hypothetical protein [Tenacibaculum sp.]|uniref:hypothetical protein n=1 Tax=Tenacibaculum sp. TaxID=1906242 RepID=UPI003D0B59FB